ncbi:MAG: twin-arginine translocation signal domain-containing protein [Actinomycetota bacterium]
MVTRRTFLKMSAAA